MKFSWFSVDITVKISEIFMQQINYEKQYTQPLLGYESIYIEQTIQVKVLEILLNLPKLIWSLLLIFHILWSSIQCIKNKTNYISNYANAFLQGVVIILWVSNFTSGVIFLIKASSKNIGVLYAEEIFFCFSTLIHDINYLSMFYWSKKFQTFSTIFRKNYNITVKVPWHKSRSIKTIARVVIWSWNVYIELHYLLLHHCPKIRTSIAYNLRYTRSYLFFVF